MLPIQTVKSPNNAEIICVYKSGHTSLKNCLPFNEIIFRTRLNVMNEKGRTVAFLPVRNPIERFVSGIYTVSKNKKYFNLGVNDWLDMLENNTHKNLHFMDVTTVLRNACFCFDDIYLYKFPDHFEQMLRDGGYEGEVPHENASTKKIVLTDSQTERVAKYYTKDIALFESIKAPGQQFDFMPI